MSGNKYIKSIVQTVVTIDEIVFAIEKYLLLLLVFGMTSAAFIEVVLRYIFSSTLLIGISELINWSFVWIVFIGIASVYKKGEHIGITFLAEKIPGKARRYVQLGINLILLIFTIQVLIIGVKFSLSQWTILTTAANIPKTFLYLAIPFGNLCLLIHIVVSTIQQLFDLTLYVEASA